MNKLYALFAIVMIAFTVQAQYIYSDFDANQNVTFTGWPNVPAIVANPDASGINTSANVAEFVRSSEQWAHSYAILTDKINFETGTTFSLKVWSPITCQVLFKLEDQTNNTISTEVMGNVETANQWVQLTYDFTGAQSGIYDKVVIFFDFASLVDNTFWFDDVQGPEFGGGAGPKPLTASDVQDNFENNGYATITNWKFQDPDLIELPIVADPVNGSNHVAKYERTGNFEWTNAQFILDHRMDLSERNQFLMKVYFSSSNGYNDQLTPTAAVKLQNSLLGANAWTTQTEAKLTVEQFDTWLTLQFDFAAISDSVNYDQVVVQLGGEGHLVPALFYFDDFHLMGPASITEHGYNNIVINPNPAVDQITFSGIEHMNRVRVFNSAGQMVIEKESVKMLSVSALPKGIYTVVAEDKEGIKYIAKLVK